MNDCNPHSGPTRVNGSSAIPAPRWRQWKGLVWKKPVWKKLHWKNSRFLLLFLPVFLLVLAPFIAAVLFIPKSYYSAGTIIIGDQEPAGAASAAWVQKLGDPADLESQLIIIRSRRMLRLALSKPGVPDAVQRECRARNSVWLFGSASDCRDLAPASPELLTYVEGRYTVEAVGRSRVVAIGYQSPIPEVSMMMANALLVSYLEDQRSSVPGGRNSSADWILEQAKSARAETSPGAASVSEAAQRRQQFYADLQKTASDLEAERRTLVSRGQLVSLAETPQIAAFPKRVPILAAGLTLALLVAGFVTLKRDTGPGDWPPAQLGRWIPVSRKPAHDRSIRAHPK
jgi:uncharacterized protein involved in exopolysaccharide biosynthesis